MPSAERGLIRNRSVAPRPHGWDGPQWSRSWDSTARPVAERIGVDGGSAPLRILKIDNKGRHNRRSRSGSPASGRGDRRPSSLSASTSRRRMLDDLRERHGAGAAAGAPADAGWTYGTSPEYLERLLRLLAPASTTGGGGGPLNRMPSVHGFRRRLPRPSRLRARQRPLPRFPSCSRTVARILRRVRGGDRASSPTRSDSVGRVEEPSTWWCRPCPAMAGRARSRPRHHARYRERCGTI
jgi:hypothetical protein